MKKIIYIKRSNASLNRFITENNFVLNNSTWRFFCLGESAGITCNTSRIPISSFTVVLMIYHHVPFSPLQPNTYPPAHTSLATTLCQNARRHRQNTREHMHSTHRSTCDPHVLTQDRPTDRHQKLKKQTTSIRSTNKTTFALAADTILLLAVVFSKQINSIFIFC